MALRTFFKNKLPSVATIRSWYTTSDLACEPGIHESCLNILRKKVERKRVEGRKLYITICFDEMHIKRFFQWKYSRRNRTLMGCPTYGEGSEGEYGKLDNAASQVIFFMANGINEKFNLPFAYHFVRSLKADEKKKLLEECIQKVNETGAIVLNISFDGIGTNSKICDLLGADLDVTSENFKPYFTLEDGKRIHIIFDVCHMEKLVQNVLARVGRIHDETGKIIQWQHFVKLLELSEKSNLNMTHKITKQHIDFQKSKMKVRLATELISNTTAEVMEEKFI